MGLIGGVAALMLLGVLVVFQLALAAGAPWGRAAYGGGSPGVLPGRLRVASAIAALVWSLIALGVARRSGIPIWAPLPDAALPVLVWVVVCLAVVAVVLNAITRSRIERAIWLPVSLLLLAAVLVVALSPS